MNKNRGLTPLAVVLMLSGSLALTGCDDKQDQQGGQQMPEVGVVTLKTEPLQITTELPGRTIAYRIAEVRPQVSGIILKRNFVEGSDIEAGVSLYQIDPATYQATYDSAKGDLAKAQAAANIAELTVKRIKSCWVRSTSVSRNTIRRWLTRNKRLPPLSQQKPPLKPHVSTWRIPKSPHRLAVVLVSHP